MKRQIAIVLMIATITVTGVTTVAIAQDNSTNTTSSENSAVMNIDEGGTLTLMDYRFEGDTVILRIDADYSQNIVVSSNSVSGTGAQRLPQKEMTLDSGMNEVKLQTQAYNGKRRVTVGSSNGAIEVSTETGGFSFNTQFPAEMLIAMFTIGSLTGIGLVVVIAYKKELDYTSDVKREL